MADRVGQQLGNYLLTRMIGQGGFAEVYLGEHVRLGTLAAVKVLNAKLVESNEVDYFQQEARTIAHLEHPHIIRVFDFDVRDGIPFLIMSYAPNGNLRQRHPRNSQLPIATIITYVKQISDALQYAHDEKLIHRDIKPENMLLGRHDEILLSDFGIALIAQSSRLQSTQDIVGTAHYMAPEQMQGKPRVASDQYSLGIIVYEWLSGSLPFYGSFTEIAIQHVLTPPPPIREKHPEIPVEIEQIVLTALSKDPHQRFGSVRAFANALEQAYQPKQSTALHSMPLTATERVENSPPPPTKVEISSPPPRTKPIVTSPPTTEPVIASPQPTSTTTGSVIFSRYPSTGPRVTLPKVPEILSAHWTQTSLVSAVAWSPDGKSIASAGYDGNIQIWNASTGKHLVSYTEHNRLVNALGWSSDGKYIASAGDGQTVQIWNASSGKRLVTYQGYYDPIQALTWAPDGVHIAFSVGNFVQVWDTAKDKRILSYSEHSSKINALGWSSDGKYIASAGDGQTVQIWNASTGKRIVTFQGYNDAIRILAWAPNSVHIAFSIGNFVQVWDTVKDKRILSYAEHTKQINALGWSPDGKYIASAGDDKTVQVWSTTTGKRIVTYQGYDEAIRTLAWAPDADGGRIAFSFGQIVQVWKAV